MAPPTAKTIVRVLLSLPIIPGTVMTLTGLGLVPVDDDLARVASPFIDPIGMPFKSFVLVLGPCKVLGALALWKVGPMPGGFARLGLMLAASCAAYGHHAIGDSAAPPLGYIGLMCSLYAMDHFEKGEKGKNE